MSRPRGQMARGSDVERGCASEEPVFWGTSRDQRREIVRELKNNGETVVYVGYGTNDDLAMQEADVGITIEAGSEITKNLSDLVIKDANNVWDCIIAARASMQKLQMVSRYVVPLALPMMLPFILFMFFGMTLPLSVALGIVFVFAIQKWSVYFIAVTVEIKQNLMDSKD